MYGIFMESVVIFKLYAGARWLMVLFLLALVYLAFREKDRRLRLFFVYLPLLLLFLFFLPLFRKIFVRIDRETYYRVLWLIPMGVTIAYAGVKLFERHRRTGLVAVSALIILCGKYVYNSPYMFEAENAYHLPQQAIDICDRIAPGEGEERLWAAFPSDLVHYVRQYDTNIQLPFGREMVVPAWDYFNEVYEVMEKPETVDTEKLLEVTRKYNCSYVILDKERKMTKDPEECGYLLVDSIGDYRIYEDPVVSEARRNGQLEHGRGESDGL